MLRTREQVRVLGPADRDRFIALAEQDPVVNVFTDYRARLTNLDERWLGGQVWGRFVGDDLVSGCHLGANLVPVQCTPDDVTAFADVALRRRRTVGTIVGETSVVAALWEAIEPRWDRPRDMRMSQPHLQISRLSTVAPATDVRLTTPEDIAMLYPACVAMYTEELGVSPERAGGAALYRARVAQLISRGHAFAHIIGDDVLFKAELGPITPHAAQLQSVWVAPRFRGTGLAPGGVATVCAAAIADGAPVVSLYVNEHNHAARRTYERVGFRETGRFATILF